MESWKNVVTFCGYAGARQKFDSDVGTSIRTFNDVMVRIRQFGSLISDWMER